MKVRSIILALCLLVSNWLGAQIVKEVPGAVLWLSADQGVITDDRGILRGSCWRDLCDNHTFRPIGDSREYPPFVVQNILNGKPIVRFQGQFALRSNSYYTYKTVFAVGKVNEGGTMIGMYNSYDKSERPKNFFSAKPNSKKELSNYINDGDVPIGGPYQEGYRCFTGIFGDDLKARLYANGEMLAEGNMKRALRDNYLLIGSSARVETGEPYLSLIGDIAEIIAYPYVLTEQQRMKVEKYLMDKYNLKDQIAQDGNIPAADKVFGKAVMPEMDKPIFPADVPAMPNITLAPKGDVDLYGLVYGDGKPLKGVVVTDGFTLTTTDEKGYYGIKRNPKARMVYISQPSGYESGMKDGVVPFYAYITEKVQRADFPLRKVNDTKHVFIAMGDPQPAQKWEMDRFTYETMRDVKQFVAGKNAPVFMMCLGDMGWDNQICYNDYKYALGRGGIPAYGVIGNHDHNQFVRNDEFADINWQKNMGPTYYSFTRGKIHYIAMDNIDYAGRASYGIHISQQQLDWLSKDLQFVPKGSTLIIGMHSNLINRMKNNATRIKNHAALMDVLKDYKVHFVTGHSHVLSTIEFEKDKIDHNVGAACGTWWRAEVGTDGAPQGYEVFEVDGDQVRWWYKPVNHDRSFQMRPYDFTKTDWIMQHKPVKGKPAEELTPETDGTTRMSGVVVLNVWDWEPAWKVEWKEDGKLQGQMTQAKKGAIDPVAYRVMYNGGREIWKGASVPPLTDNLFYAKPSPTAKKIEFIVTNRFGEVFTSALEL